MSAEAGVVAGGEGADAPAFSPLGATLMAIVGVVAFSALMVLLAYAPDLRSGEDGGAHALSKSAVGFAGLAEALRLSGEPVVIERTPPPPGRRTGLLVLTPTPSTDWDKIDALKFDGPVLVVLPKWLTAPDVLHRGWVAKAQVMVKAAESPTSLMNSLGLRHRSGVAAPALRGAGGLFVPGGVIKAGPIDSLQSISAKGWVPLLTDDTGAIVLARWGDRPLYVLAEPDLMNTQGIKSLDTLGAGLAILRGLRRGDGPFIFDVTLNGFARQRSILRLLFDPPFLGVTLCLALAAILAATGRRFGPTRRAGRAIPLGAAALVDNTAALIRLAGKEHRMGGGYAELTGEIAARAVGAPRTLRGEALGAFLDRLSAQRRLPEPLSELATQARISQSAERTLAAARRLYAWRLALVAGERSGVSGTVSGTKLDPTAPTGLRQAHSQPEEAVP